MMQYFHGAHIRISSGSAWMIVVMSLFTRCSTTAGKEFTTLGRMKWTQPVHHPLRVIARRDPGAYKGGVVGRTRAKEGQPWVPRVSE
jgi:hypothetical protein